MEDIRIRIAFCCTFVVVVKAYAAWNFDFSLIEQCFKHSRIIDFETKCSNNITQYKLDEQQNKIEFALGRM